MIDGKAYAVAEALSLPESVFSRVTFGEEDVANIEETARRVLHALEEASGVVRDAVEGKLLRVVDYHPPSFENQLLREAGEITSLSGTRVKLEACANGALCVSQYIDGFRDRFPMGYFRKDEWTAITTSGIHTTTEKRPCLLCVRNRYTCLKLSNHLAQKSRACGTPWTSAGIQPFYNGCASGDAFVYREDKLIKVGDFQSYQKNGVCDLTQPIVHFDKNDYFWYEDNGVMRIDQSRLFAEVSAQHAPSATSRARGQAGRDSGAGLLDNADPRGDLPQPGDPFFERRRGRISAELQPSLFLSRLCAPLYSVELRELLFAQDFRQTAMTSPLLGRIDPGPSLGYTCWFVSGGRLERLAADCLLVKLLVVRLLIFGLLRRVNDDALAYWLHLYIDQHMPFYSIVLHKGTISASDVIEPCSVTPLCEENIPLDEFLSLNALLSFRAWGSPTQPMTQMALKLVPNTTTSLDKSITWDGLPEDQRAVLRVILRCVFLGNFRHAQLRPGIAQREQILNSSIEELLARIENDPLVICKAIMECITVVFENQGMGKSGDQACQRYMAQTIADCDSLLRMAVGAGRPITRSDIRHASKTHIPVFTRSHRNEMTRPQLIDKTLLAAAHALSLKLLPKGLSLSIRYCVFARAEGKTFAEKLKLAGFSPRVLGCILAIIEAEQNQKKSYKKVADLLLARSKENAYIMCRLYSCLPSVQRANLIPLDKATYDRQVAVARTSPAYRRHFYICIACLTVDVPHVQGRQNAKRLYSDIDKPDRVFCPHCVDRPSAVKMSLLGVRLQLMDNFYQMCTECLEMDLFTTTKINLEGFFVCTGCIHRSLQTSNSACTPIWPKIDHRHVRGREALYAETLEKGPFARARRPARTTCS
jgi:hypothetical protein